MNEKNAVNLTTNTWEKEELIERFEVRFRVISTIHTAPQSLGPENVKETYHLSDGRLDEMEKPQTTEYSVDGEVEIYPSRVVLRYPEPDSTGLGKCETALSYWRSRDDLLELNRTGSSAVHCFFDRTEPRQHVVFQTPLGSFEPIITLKDLVNLMDCGVGKLMLAYTVDFPNIYTEYIELVIFSRRLAPSEWKGKHAAPRPDEDSIRELGEQMEESARFKTEVGEGRDA